MFKCNDKASVLMIESMMRNMLLRYNDEGLVLLGHRIYCATVVSIKFPWYINLIKFIGRFDDNKTAGFVFKHRPKIARNYIEAVLNHLKNGKSQTDPKSICGFDQPQLNRLVEALEPFATYLIDQNQLAKSTPAR